MDDATAKAVEGSEVIETYERVKFSCPAGESHARRSALRDAGWSTALCKLGAGGDRRLA